MKRLILHIGIHKTGTSALQQFFLSNRCILEKQGVYYPLTGCNNKGMHHPLFLPLDKKNIDSSAKSFTYMVSELKTEIEDREQVLISSEMITKLIRRDLFEANELLELFDRISVILYLRRQDDYFESAYRQSTKIRWAISFDSFYEGSKNESNYYKLLKNCVKLFGKENIIVRPFEVGSFEGGTIFHDFFSSMDWDLTEEYDLPGQDVNVSLGLDELHFKILYNQLPSSIEEKRKIAFMLESYAADNSIPKGKKQRLLSPSQRLEIIRQNEDDNKKIAVEFLNRPDGQLFKNPLPDLMDDWQPYGGLSKSEIRKISNYLVHKYPESKKMIFKAIAKGLVFLNSDSRRSASRLLGSLKFII